MYLENATPAELVHSFIYGLKEPIRKHVKMSNPYTIEDAQTAALTMEERTDYQQPLQFYKNTNNRATDNFVNRDIVPMELGNVQKHWNSKGKNKYQDRGGPSQRGNANSRYNQRGRGNQYNYNKGKNPAYTGR
jgi:hypothetical protein